MEGYSRNQKKFANEPEFRGSPYVLHACCHVWNRMRCAAADSLLSHQQEPDD